MFVEYSWNIPMRYPQYNRNKFPMKFWGISQSNVLGISNISIIINIKYITGFELAVHNSQFVKHFGSLRMNFYILSKNCESLKSDTSRIFRVIYRTSYIRSYFKPNKYSLLNNNVISQRFIVQINFKLHASFISIIFVTI